MRCLFLLNLLLLLCSVIAKGNFFYLHNFMHSKVCISSLAKSYYNLRLYSVQTKQIIVQQSNICASNHFYQIVDEYPGLNLLACPLRVSCSCSCLISLKSKTMFKLPKSIQSPSSFSGSRSGKIKWVNRDYHLWFYENTWIVPLRSFSSWL